jgi:type I restriction enzyme, S subunit
LNHHSKIDSTKVLKPQLRFPLFRKFWNYKRFEELYKLQVTNSFSRENLNYNDGEVLNIHYGDIHTKFPSHIFVDKIKIPLINPEVDLSRIREECYCKEGDLIIADASEDYGDLGKSIEIINLGNKRMLAGLHTYLARPITQLVSKGFISYLMMSWKVRKQIMVLSNGTKVYGLPRKSLLETLLVIPSSEEQKKIVSFLSNVDLKIEKLTLKKELLDEYKKGVMQKLFSQEIRFKDDDGNHYPDWEDKRLGELSKINTGESNKVDAKPNGNFRFFDRSGDILMSNKFLFDCEALIVPGEGAEFLPKYFTGKFDLHQRAYTIHSFKGLVCKYLNYYMTYYKNYLIKYAVGSTVKSLRLPIFEKMIIFLPSLTEQEKIASFLSSVDSKVESVSSQIDKTKEFKKGLLQQMFV